jgi:hypothetical protein
MMNNTIRNEKHTKSNAFHKLLNPEHKLNKESIVRFVPMILFISFLFVLYIANKYYAEKSVLKMNTMLNEVKDHRAEALTMKAELKNKTKQSELEKITQEMGLKKLNSAPYKIELEK